MIFQVHGKWEQEWINYSRSCFAADGFSTAEKPLITLRFL